MQLKRLRGVSQGLRLEVERWQEVGGMLAGGGICG